MTATESVEAAAYTVSTDGREADATAEWTATTIVVVHATAGGQVGTGWTYGTPAWAGIVGDLLADVVVGRDAFAVPGCWSAVVAAVRNAARAGAVGEWDVRWFEEPVSSDDLDGLREVRDQVPADVTAGGYGTDIGYFRRTCAAVDCLRIDATRCGGYTELLRSAAVAASFGLTVSGHCAPRLHAPVAAATPDLRHLEWFHDHIRIESMLFDGCLDPAGGAVTPDMSRPATA